MRTTVLGNKQIGGMAVAHQDLRAPQITVPVGHAVVVARLVALLADRPVNPVIGNQVQPALPHEAAVVVQVNRPANPPDAIRDQRQVERLIDVAVLVVVLKSG